MKRYPAQQPRTILGIVEAPCRKCCSVFGFPAFRLKAFRPIFDLDLQTPKNNGPCTAHPRYLGTLIGPLFWALMQVQVDFSSFFGILGWHWSWQLHLTFTSPAFITSRTGANTSGRQRGEVKAALLPEPHCTSENSSAV